MSSRLIAVALLGGGIYSGMRSRAAAEATLAASTDQAAVPFVDVVHPRADAPDQELSLPGKTQAFTDTPIYARTNGYLKQWYFDIGAHVKQGQLLAADRNAGSRPAAAAGAAPTWRPPRPIAKLAGITAARTANLLKTQSVSTQERDNAAGAYAADQAIVASRQADVGAAGAAAVLRKGLCPVRRRDHRAQHRHRRADQCRCRRAPHASCSTWRRPSTLRVYVAVPEVDRRLACMTGATPTLTLDEYPGQVFHGTLVRNDDCDRSRRRARCWSRWTWTTRRTAAARRLCVRAFRICPGAHPVGDRPLQHAAVSQRGPACRRGAQRQGASWCRSRSAATMATGWR